MSIMATKKEEVGGERPKNTQCVWLPYQRRADRFLYQLQTLEAASNSRKVTRNQTVHTARTAAHRVLNTIELLESILSNLPIRDIFILQRVSRQFYDTIAYSIQIRQKLFIRSRVPEQTWDLCSEGLIVKPRHHPQRLQLLPHSASNTNRIGDPLTPALLNPLLEQTYLNDTGEPLLSRLRFDEYDRATFQLKHFSPSYGSWRSMQLTEPSCEKVCTQASLLEISRATAKLSAFIERLEVEEADGVTLGSLVDAMYTSPLVQQLHFDSFRNARMRRAEIVHRGADELLEEDKTEVGGEDVSEAVRIHIDFLGMIFPNDEEWARFEEEGVLE